MQKTVAPMITFTANGAEEATRTNGIMATLAATQRRRNDTVDR